MIDNGFGIKVTYINDGTREILQQIEAPVSKLKEISEKVKSGEIIPFTITELARIQFSQIQLPSQIEDGVWLTDAYVKGNDIYFEAKSETVINKSDIDYSVLNEMKQDMIQGLQEDGIFSVEKEQMVKENVHLIYIFKDSRGKEFARISIAPQDVCPTINYN